MDVYLKKSKRGPASSFQVGPTGHLLLSSLLSLERR